MSGRRVLGRGGAALALIAVALAVTVPVAAATRTFVYGPAHVTRVRVRGTHGYRINFSENSKRYFSLEAMGRGTKTSFSTHGGPIAGARLSGDLGRRGEVGMRFVPAGKPSRLRVPSFCEGPAGTLQPGRVVGQARFRGERGFTEVRVRGARAELESWPRLRCHAVRYRPSKGAREQQAIVRASRHNPGPTVGFQATRFYPRFDPPARGVHFSAQIRQQEGRISIFREVTATAPTTSFQFVAGPHLPEEITVTPLRPFTGSANFERTPESTLTWSGDLAVDFPGLAPLPLTGRHFSTRVCADRGCVDESLESGGYH